MLHMYFSFWKTFLSTPHRRGIHFIHIICWSIRGKYLNSFENIWKYLISTYENWGFSPGPHHQIMTNGTNSAYTAEQKKIFEVGPLLAENTDIQPTIFFSVLFCVRLYISVFMYVHRNMHKIWNIQANTEPPPFLKSVKN